MTLIYHGLHLRMFDIKKMHRGLWCWQDISRTSPCFLFRCLRRLSNVSASFEPQSARHLPPDLWQKQVNVLTSMV